MKRDDDFVYTESQKNKSNQSDERGEQVDTVDQLPCSNEPLAHSGYRKQYYATTKHASQTSSLLNQSGTDTLAKQIERNLDKAATRDGKPSDDKPLEDLEIENQRLTSTIFILNQKIRVMEDASRESDDRLQAKIKQLIQVNKMFEKEIEELASEQKNLKQQNGKLNSKLKEMESKIEEHAFQDKKHAAITSKMQFDIDELTQ